MAKKLLIKKFPKFPPVQRDLAIVVNSHQDSLVKLNML